MEQIVAPIGKNHGPALLFPTFPKFEEFRPVVEASQEFQCSGRRANLRKRGHSPDAS
jgi:hypothetical protein